MKKIFPLIIGVFLIISAINLKAQSCDLPSGCSWQGSTTITINGASCVYDVGYKYAICGTPPNQEAYYKITGVYSSDPACDDPAAILAEAGYTIIQEPWTEPVRPTTKDECVEVVSGFMRECYKWLTPIAPTGYYRLGACNTGWECCETTWTICCIKEEPSLEWNYTRFASSSTGAPCPGTDCFQVCESP